METQKTLAKLDDLFAAPASTKVPSMTDRSRKPSGNGDQRTCED